MSEQDSPLDIGALLSRLGEVQQNIQHAQEAAAEQVVVGRAGGGSVTVTVTGGLDFQEVTIDPAVVDPSDVDMLQDLVLAAVRDAVEQAQGLAAGALGGLDLGNLGGLLGE